MLGFCRRTCDVLVQYGILFYYVFDQTAGCTVEYQHFPLRNIVRKAWGGTTVVIRTSPCVTWRMVLKMTRGCQQLSGYGLAMCSLSRWASIMETMAAGAVEGEPRRWGQCEREDTRSHDWSSEQA